MREDGFGSRQRYKTSSKTNLKATSYWMIAGCEWKKVDKCAGDGLGQCVTQTQAGMRCVINQLCFGETTHAGIFRLLLLRHPVTQTHILEVTTVWCSKVGLSHTLKPGVVCFYVYMNGRTQSLANLTRTWTWTYRRLTHVHCDKMPGIDTTFSCTHMRYKVGYKN